MKPIHDDQWWHRADVSCETAWRTMEIYPNSEVPLDEHHRQALRRGHQPDRAERSYRPTAWPDERSGGQQTAFDIQREGGRLSTDNKR